MLAYAAQRPRIAERKSSPNAMLLVICVHIVVLAAVISAKMDLPARIRNTAQPVIFVPAPPLPPLPNSIDRPHQTTHRLNLFLRKGIDSIVQVHQLDTD